MNNPLKTPAAANLGLFLVRAPLGVYFCMAGYMKITGPGGLAGFVRKAGPMVPTFMPTALGTAYLYLLPFTELSVGALLVLGLFTRVAGGVASLLITSFMIAVTGIAVRDMPFHQNVVFLGVALLALTVGGGDFSLDKIALDRPSGPMR